MNPSKVTSTNDFSVKRKLDEFQENNKLEEIVDLDVLIKKFKLWRCYLPAPPQYRQFFISELLSRRASAFSNLKFALDNIDKEKEKKNNLF